MVQRRYKLAAAATTVLVGFCLAWPLRRAEDPSAAAPLGAPPSDVAWGDPASEGATPSAAEPLIPALSASLTMSNETHGAFGASAEPGVEPITPTGPYPSADDFSTPGRVYAVVGGGLEQGTAPDASEAAPHRVHVVHNGDTLQRLAKRYLGDEGRALELFELNRDQLVNPHLLPIGAELKIPGEAAED